MTFDTRLTELIALGAAVAANCAACLEHHVGKAREIGLPAEEVEAALEVGRRVRQGAAGALDRVAARLGTAPPAAAAAEWKERSVHGADLDQGRARQRKGNPEAEPAVAHRRLPVRLE